MEGYCWLPSVVWFYLRQSFLPLAVGPSYPLRPVSATSDLVASFALPLLGDLKVTSALFFDVGVYLVVAGMAAVTLDAIGNGRESS